MRRVLTTGMLAILLLAPVACGGADPEAAPDAADLTQEAAPDAAEADASLVEAGDADPAAATADPALADGTAGAEGADPATAEAPTLTPAEVELITNFRPPSKGSEDALVTLYEFSDYI
ncbi:MAG: hypothetical protein H6648_09280 [Caldilineae bacterium]|nr:hypothetical protein [Chloroflexota bacterium]MCB9177340.1 hypothetical protein [Caldilineae bacterium]